MNILVTGGAGYIGSHMARMLVSRGISVTVLDSLEMGHQAAVPKEATFIEGNTGDKESLRKCFAKPIDAVIHFAAYLSVEESVREPIKYFNNNVISPVALLETMAEAGTKKIIFSSSAAVYGNPTQVPIPETHLKNPESPYGLSKWCFEELLRVFDKSHQIKSISLRYFNAAGASLDGAHGEAHRVETHIIPLSIQAALGKMPEFSLFGSDYETRDGSCERDYIHIEDLGEAHIMAVDALINGHETDVYNVATGTGVTNKELVSQVQKTTGVRFPVKNAPRRSGDPGILVADPTKIKKEFGWNPKYSTLETIVENAWNWHKNHPHGYGNNS
jgi:UDP-glucose 4-epimerase